MLVVVALTGSPKPTALPSSSLGAQVDQGQIIAGLSRVVAWYGTARMNDVARARQRIAERVPVSPRARRPGIRPLQSAPALSANTGGCAVPACVCARESGGNIRAQNPVSSASGKYEFLDSTWAGFGGYAHAKDAPEQVQDERARQVWAATGGSAWYPRCW